MVRGKERPAQVLGHEGKFEQGTMYQLIVSTKRHSPKVHDMDFVFKVKVKEIGSTVLHYVNILLINLIEGCAL